MIPQWIPYLELFFSVRFHGGNFRDGFQLVYTARSTDEINVNRRQPNPPMTVNSLTALLIGTRGTLDVPQALLMLDVRRRTWSLFRTSTL